MSILTFFVVALASVLITIVYLTVTMILPAFKSAKIQESLVALTQCLTHLSRGPFAEGEITNGGYLHDRFYKMGFMVLTHKVNLKFGVLRSLTSGSEVGIKKFHREMQNLDPETRQSVVSAVRAMAKILWLRNPLIFTLTMIKQIIISRDFKEPTRDKIRSQAVKSAESMALMGYRNRDFAFIPISH